MLRMSAYEYAYLLPMGWPCIYSRCSTNWMVIRIHSHWMRYSLSTIDIGFGKGYREKQFIWDNLPSLLGDPA